MMSVLKKFLRAIYRVLDRLFSNPMLTLALIVLGLAAINYKTLISGLPTSVPEVDSFIAGNNPVLVTLSGAVTGASRCWRMRYTFFNADGSPLLHDREHAVRLTTPSPEATLTLPRRQAYLLRLQSEEIIADPARDCLPTTAAANLSSKASQSVVEFSDGAHLHNACDFTGKTNDCTLEIR